MFFMSIVNRFTDLDIIDICWTTWSVSRNQKWKHEFSIKMGYYPIWMRSNSGVSKPPCSIVAGGRDIAKFVLFKVICDLMKHQITSLFNVQFFPKRHKFLAAAAGNISVWYLHVNKSWCLFWKSSGLTEIFRTRRSPDTWTRCVYHSLNLIYWNL